MQPFIEEFYREGVTTGCGAGPIHCWSGYGTRAQMAVFMDRTFPFYP